MADTNEIDPVDRTPIKVIDGMLAEHTPYKHDECIPCGAVIKMGFFFDGFGRNRDHDDPNTSRYSNICRLWEAHRDMLDRRRQSMPNQFWYRFYYSGLGTELNKDAENNVIVSASVKAATAAGKMATKSAQSTVQKITAVDKVLDLKKAPAKAAKKAAKEAFDEMSFRPITNAYADLIAEAQKVPAKLGRVLTVAAEDRWVLRGKAAVRATLYDLKKNPLKAGWAIAKGLFAGVAMDSIPQVRDNAAAAWVFGTGVDDRIAAALKQFEGAYADAKTAMPKVQRVEVSVFGADRGGVLARVFVNELVRKYKRRDDLDLRVGSGTDKGDPIEIKFLGLLDAVSSIMAENKLLDLVPFANVVKQNYSDRQLGVPAAVKRCVHFAAAHELRFYQRLDSLEKTRGDQYLYPGTSEDITGGSPPGSMGFRAELQRVALRDMLNEALMAGAAVDQMESLAKYKGPVFTKFTLAHPISDGKTSYKLPDLINAYRALVPRAKGLNFQDHMQVFLHWLAVRYQSPAFRDSITSNTDAMKRAHQVLVQQRKDAEAAYMAERARSPLNQVALGQAYARQLAAQEAEQRSLRSTVYELARPVTGVWDRIRSESTEMSERLQQQGEWEASLKRVQAPDTSMGIPYDSDANALTEVMIKHEMLTPEQVALAQAWQDGANGKKPLPPPVMALFDLLVHDTMLTSWHDHILSSTLYFQTRAKDTFGKTDFAKEKKERARDDENAKRVDQLSAANAAQRASQPQM